MPKTKSEKWTLIRGADGELYLLSKTNKPIKLEPEVKKEVIEILEGCEDKLSNKLSRHFGLLLSGSRTHLGVPTVFVRHR